MMDGMDDSISLRMIEEKVSGIIFEYRQNISLIMLELKVTLPRATHHSHQTVKCNGSQYTLPLPLETYRFVEITQEIVFKADQETLITLLSGKRDSLPSFLQFYKMQDDGIKYFNLRPELNFDDLALKFLSETDKILIELDNCRFADLLALLRKAYDTYAQKLHSKLNRRIKKYLTLSTRSEGQKQQIKKLLDLIKAQSTDEEVEDKPMIKKESPVKIAKEPSVKEVKNSELEEAKKEQKWKEKEKEKTKAEPEAKIRKDEKKQVKQPQKKLSPEQKQAKKDNKHSSFFQQPKKDKEKKKDKIEHHNKHQDNEEDWEDVQSDNEVQEQAQPKPTKENKKHQHHKKKEGDEWQDIHDQKMHKRQQKNLRRKHEKFDIEGKKQNQPTEKDYESSNAEPSRRQRQPRRKDNGNGNRNHFQRSKEKAKKDMRVLLGLNGDTDDGWRERGRVERVPVQPVEQQKPKKKWMARDEQQSVPKSETSEKDSSKSPFQKQPKPDKKPQKVDQTQPKKEEPIIQAQKVVILPTQGALQKVFSFPADGKSFVLDPSKQYRVRVNNSFWVMLEKSHVKIEKDKAGYIREGKFSSSEENLIEAQDMTISLSGMCNLEDGGVPFGNPNIQEFTGTDSQWFHLKELQVYAYK